MKNQKQILAFLIGERIYDCHIADNRLPVSADVFLEYWQDYKAIALMVENSIQTGQLKPSFIEIGEGVDVKALVWPEM